MKAITPVLLSALGWTYLYNIWCHPHLYEAHYILCSSIWYTTRYIQCSSILLGNVLHSVFACITVLHHTELTVPCENIYMPGLYLTSAGVVTPLGYTYLKRNCLLWSIIVNHQCKNWTVIDAVFRTESSYLNKQGWDLQELSLFCILGLWEQDRGLANWVSYH